MTNVTWTIDSMEWDNESGGVITVHWRAATQDGEHYADAYGSLGFSPDPNSPDFVALEDLTPEDVLEWVKVRDEVDGLEQSLLNQIEKKKTPKTTSGLPW